MRAAHATVAEAVSAEASKRVREVRIEDSR